MQRIWTVVLSVWAMLAIVAVLAWSHRPAPAPPPQAAAADPRRQDGERQAAARRRPARRSRRVARDDADLRGAAMTAHLERIAFRAVGTHCSAAVTAGAGDRRRAQRALAAAQDEVAACEAASLTLRSLERPLEAEPQRRLHGSPSTRVSSRPSGSP